ILHSASAGFTSLPVTLTVTDQQPFIANPARLTFSAISGANPPAASVAITGDPSALFTVVSDAPWLFVSSSSASPPATLTVTASTPGLAAGTYNGTITLTPTAPGRNVVVIPVTLNVSAPLTVMPSFLLFRVQSGDTAPQSQTISLNTPAGTTAAYNLSM